MRDHAYLEGIGAVANLGGSREIYQALKLSRMKIAEQISVLSPKSKDISVDRSATADTTQSSLSDTQSKEQIPSKILSPESPGTEVLQAPAPQADDKASTAPARMMQRSIELERNNATARSVLRLAGDLLQANGNGQPIRQSQRSSALLRASPKQRLKKSLSDGGIKFNWAKSSVDLQASLSLEERAWWWPCAPKGVTSPVKVSQNSSRVLTR